ncbi:hypothetical protein DV736_g3816, partial [Chaetothyriales sp. CBS 134916]
MVRLREIPRTATFAWSPDANAPWIATGTKSGAVDVDFSNETCLELWDLALDSEDQSQELSPSVTLPTETGFHDLAWTPAEDHERGIIAGALDNGTLGLWDADGLVQNASTASILQEKVHSGAIKALQFNPKIPNFVATGGAKGELFISDLNHLGAPIRLGSTAARADDIDCLDWNKRVSNILVTGSTGGFVTVWDMKTKKESLTLNNSGRKAVSAIAWDPTKPTRLITAVPLEQEPVILVWDLRNSNAPERTLRGHDSGVLSLSWCPQDSDLLLSCGKDNRTILWNPQTGQPYGDYPVVTNWTFQTRWNPHNPNFFATASFDGKIQVQTIQNTNPGASQEPLDQSQAADGEDFFSRAANQPQASTFSLPKAPKWLEVPAAVSFGFGGRLITVGLTEPGKSRTSKIDISKFEVDSTVGTSTQTFEKAITSGSLTQLCEERISTSKSEEEKTDWQVIQTLVSSNPRSELVKYLGFEDSPDAAADTFAKLDLKEDEEDAPKPAVNGVGGKRSHKRFQSIFESSTDGDFLSDLAAAKGTKTNNPFHIYTDSESEADKRITRHLILGQFVEALDIALREDRMSDAFMIAICGGQTCINKAQEAYLAKQGGGPSYLRLLAAVAGKNLWDTVHNADLANWKEVVVTLCTFADAKEFPDLCEAIGDRLEDLALSNPSARKDASLCYLAGSKLEKVVPIWIQELKEHEDAGSDDADASSAFSLHARGLQDLIEKVTIFRNVVNFKDTELSKASDWKLEQLYSKYLEYADVVAAHGQLEVAQKYLDLLPTAYPGADIAKARISQASRKQPAVATEAAQTTTSTPAKSRPSARPGYAAPDSIFSAQAPSQPSSYVPPGQSGPSYGLTGQLGPVKGPSPQLTSSYAPPTAAKNPYAPKSTVAPVNLYAPTHQLQTQPPPTQTTPYGIPQAVPIAPPTRQYPQSSAIPPPSQAKNLTSWNDVPEDFAKPTRSGRATPSAPSVASPFGQPMATTGVPPPTASPFGGTQRRASPVPPPPKGAAPPARVTSPLTGSHTPAYQPERPSSASNAYAAPVTSPPIGQTVTTAAIPRGPSPFAPPPSRAPPPNRYTPAPTSRTPQPAARPGRPAVAPPPQASSVPASPPPVNPYAPSHAPLQQSRPPVSGGPPTLQQLPAPLGQAGQNQFSASGPPAGTRAPQQQAAAERPSTAGSEKKAPSVVAKKHPKGDRSHIPAQMQPIFTILSAEMERVKARAPSSFQVQVKDTEKRLDILYDHLNNEDLIKADTVQQLVELSHAMQAKDFTRAQEIQMEVHRDKVEECGNWMVGVKRLVGMSRATG